MSMSHLPTGNVGNQIGNLRHVKVCILFSFSLTIYSSLRSAKTVVRNETKKRVVSYSSSRWKITDE